jgi:hypothetical protein
MKYSRLLILSLFLILNCPVQASSNLDVNGDSLADILWRNQSTGQNWLWTMDGLSVSQSKSINTIGLDWEIAGRGDFDGDGKSDILWRNSVTGRNWIYLMDGTTIRTSAELNYISDLGWKIKGVTDLNGDGKDDVVWHHQSTGRTWIYLLNGLSITTSKGGQTVSDLGWEIVATGDINGDGKGDVIWRHSGTGKNYVWLMNSTNIQSQYVLNSISSAWDIVGTGDLNGDNTDDIVWRNSSSGLNWAYLMNGGQIGVSKQINTIADSDWHIRTLGDVDGDNKVDIFWRHQGNGKTYAYLMDGHSIRQAGYSSTIGLDWEVVSASRVETSQVVVDDCANSASTSCSLGLNSSQGGSIESNGDGDVFVIDVTEEGSLTLYSSGSTDVVGSLYEQGSSALLLEDDNSGTGVNFSFTYNVTAKRYYLRVLGNVGDYTLSSEFTASSTADAGQYYQDNISGPIVQSKCIACHTSTGVAATSRLHLVNQNTANYQEMNQANWQAFMALGGVDSAYVLSKVQGSLGHGGGSQLVFGSDDYSALASYLGLVTGEEYTTSAKGFWEGVGLSDNKQTLRRAAIIVAGRMPTDAEYAAVADNQDASLKVALKNLMQGEGFHSFLTEGANDQLLIEKFLEGGTDFLDFNTPNLVEGAKLNYEYYLDGRIDEFYQDIALPAHRGFTNAAGELIAHVVENDKPYSEVLTADYTMLNPALNRIYRGTASFDDNANQQEYKPGKMAGMMLQDDNYTSEAIQDFGIRIDSEGTIITWPHAGILNDPGFLSRYPSTATNRNRARSRWAQYFFLDFDIEKSAARTNDPIALADKDNPTMKNPNCTVCHIPMDPIAGAFQDHGDFGHYKDQWGGKDSLAESYKFVEGSPYQEGDTWYRDMREPGFYGDIVPKGEDSMPWLAQQIVNDARFAPASVKFWWPAIMGVKAISAPEEISDLDYQSKADAFSQQSLFIKGLADDFRQHMNLKDALVDMLMSPWFKANSMSDAQREIHASNKTGVGMLLSPERLDRKTKAIVGKSWGEHYPEWKNYQRYTELTEAYRLTYGGIDSNGVINRATEMTSVMSQVALTHAAEMACGVVLGDSVKEEGQRLLFKNGLSKTTTPYLVSDTIQSVSGYRAQNTKAYSLSETYLEAGKYNIGVSYLNEYWDEATNTDYDLIIDKFVLKDASGDTVYEVDGGDIIDLGGRIGCGGEHGEPLTGRDFNLWGNCTVELPINITTKGNYSVDIFAYKSIWQNGDWAPDGVYRDFEMGISIFVNDAVTQNTVGQQKIKQNIAELIGIFLGDFVTAEDAEVDQLYQLFIQSMEAKKSRSNWEHIQEEGSACDFPYHEYTTDERDGWEVGNDPQYVMSAWRTVIFYLMTDYRYLHE